jgi:hypothetical protein
MHPNKELQSRALGVRNVTSSALCVIQLEAMDKLVIFLFVCWLKETACVQLLTI